MNEIAGMLVSALGQGFIYAPMALGVFLTFSILKTPDLTVEGSFVFGMTACVVDDCRTSDFRACCWHACRSGSRTLYGTFAD